MGEPSDLHYQDGQHRWTPPDPSIDVEGWRAQVWAHIAEAAVNGGCHARKKRPAPEDEPHGKTGVG